MKKVLVILLCAVMTLGLVACGSENEKTQLDNSKKANELASESFGVDSDNTIVSDNNVVANDETSVDELNMSFEISGDGTHLMILDGDCLANFNGTFFWIRLYDETGNDGICMSLSPDGWNLSHIAADKIYYEHFQDEPLVTDLKSSIWTIEVMHDDFIQAVENCSSYEVIYKDFNNDDNTRTVLNGSGSFVFSVRSSDSNANELSVDNQTNSYSQLVGTWEEDSDLIHRARYTFYEDGKVKLEYTESEGADCGENAKFDGVNASWAWTTGDLAGFGGALGPMEGFDGNSFTIPAANAYEEAKRFIKTNWGQKENQTVQYPYSFIGVKYFNDGPTWGASEFVLKGADENGLPTEIVISNSGIAVSGLELDGSFSIKITDYLESDNILVGSFVGAEHDTVKGEFVSSKGDRLIIEID